MIQEFCNRLLFPLRQKLPSLRSQYSEALEGDFVQDLVSPDLAQGLSRETLKVSLFYAEILERVPWQKFKPVRVLDLGCKSFFYAPALASFLRRRARGFHLTGVELDGGRFYSNYYRRRELAKYYADLSSSPGGEVHYEECDWLVRPEEHYDLITCFFPFLFSDLHEGWGLPQKFFSPKDFYGKMLREAETLLLVHQGKEEREESLHLLKELGGSQILMDEDVTTNPWMNRQHPVYLLYVKSSNFYRVQPPTRFLI